MFKQIRINGPLRKLKTLAECWEEFSSQVIPESENRAEELRLARVVFYAGAAFLMDQNKAIGEVGVSEDVGAAHLSAWNKELEDFAAMLAADQQQEDRRRH